MGHSLLLLLPKAYGSAQSTVMRVWRDMQGGMFTCNVLPFMLVHAYMQAVMHGGVLAWMHGCTLVRVELARECRLRPKWAMLLALLVSAQMSAPSLAA